MDFVAVVDQVIALLCQRGRMTYRTLQRQFQLDDDALHDLKDELLYAHPEVRDDAGRGLVWTGDSGTAPAAPAAPVAPPGQAPLAYTPSYLAEKILTSRSALEGERKQVTVLFADLKGSMELLADRDPEEARDLLDPVLERMMAAVHRYEGTVNQVMGDGIMALFGAPLAHEDHAIRACYAALAMHAAIRIYAEEARRAHGITVQMRVGLHSGEVVVRAIGNDLHMDYSAVGQTTHLAARMEQLAPPGSIRLTADTLRLVEGLVQVTALGPIPVKGLPEPVEVFELDGATTLRGRFQARVVGGLTRFVGRDPEVAALVQALERAGAGHGQVVALVGEAGVGKSRLVYEWVHSHYTEGWRVLESTSVSYGKATPYFPVLDLLRRYAVLDEHDDLRTIQAKVTGQLLTLDAALQDAIPPLLALLDALPDDSPFRQLDPPERRQRTLTALKRVLLRESQRQRLLLLFEDLHWIDAETQALLDSLVESLPTAHLLLLVNYRPEYQHGWSSKTFYTQLRLDPLPPASADALLQALLGHDPSLATLTQLLIARTQGNPFFLEESVRTVVETGGLVGEPGAYRLAQSLQSLQVPATVQTVLAARIDRLPPETKRLLQTAAVIGTDVSLPLLTAIAALSDTELHRSLAHLQSAEFLYETRLFPEMEYTFKHALTHEVAYGSLLLERRRVLHAHIVETLEGLAGDRVAEQVERLAHHALRGEVWDKALTYGRQAGTKAMVQSAYLGAVGYFEQALEALRHLPAQRDTQEQAIDLRFALRNALLPLAAHQRILALLREAEPLAEALDDPTRLGRVCVYKEHSLVLLGAEDEALEAIERAHTLAATSGDVTLQIMADARLGVLYRLHTDYQHGITILRQTLPLLEGLSPHERFGGVIPPAIFARFHLGECLAEMGAFAEALAQSAEALQIATTIDHAWGETAASRSLGYIYLRKGELHNAIPLLERAWQLSRAGNFHSAASAAAGLLGCAYALLGRVTEALTLLEEARARDTWVIYLPALGEAYLLLGHAAEASDLAQQALAYSRARQQHGTQAQALWLLGQITMQHDLPRVREAHTHHQHALALAEARGMRPLQAHCHLALGTLYATTRQWQQAHAALSAAMALYGAMDMTFWLPQVEAGLAQLQGR